VQHIPAGTGTAVSEPLTRTHTRVYATDTLSGYSQCYFKGMCVCVRHT
jgi:hypothetical protein